jgi:hypothetical protein
MRFHFAQIVTDLVEAVSFRGKTESCQDCQADPCAPPSVHLSATVEEDLHHPHHAGVVDLDAGDFRAARSNG